MRFTKLDRYLLLLALLFVLAVLRKGDVPGEGVLPDVYRATIHRPLLAPMAAAAHGDELHLVAVRSELEAARREIAQLKEQLATRDDLAAYFRALEWEARPEAIPGWVISIDSDTFTRHFRINRGRLHDVEIGMPVVVGRALMGVVVGANDHQAVVRRVDDPRFRLEIEIETDGGVERGVARGDGDRGLDVHFVRRTAGLKAGDPVFTSRYHRRIPPGLLVGKVERVEDVDQDGVHEVTVAPAAAFGRWAQIDVLRRLDN